MSAGKVEAQYELFQREDNSVLRPRCMLFNNNVSLCVEYSLTIDNLVVMDSLEQKF